MTTQKLLDTSDFNVETWLDKKVVDKFTRDENSAFVSGLGIKNPMGFLAYDVSTDPDTTRPWGTLQYIPSGAAGGFPFLSGSGIAGDPDCLIDLSLSLKPAYLKNAKWAMRRSTAAVIRKMKDVDGRYIWQDNLTEGGRPLLLGYPVLLWEDLPAIGSNSLSIGFGDWSNYVIHDHRLGIRMLRDPFTKKGWVKFYTYKRVAGNIVAEGFDSIKLLKFSVS
jgi:HK97 family phage major capsid protein